MNYFVIFQDAIGNSGIYWFFGGWCAVNFVFCLVVVKETKGKTIEEISVMFGGPKTEEQTSRSASASDRSIKMSQLEVDTDKEKTNNSTVDNSKDGEDRY